MDLDRPAERRQISLAAAEKLLAKPDDGRNRYIRRYFQRDIADPLHFGLVVNTDGFDHEAVADMIAAGLGARQSELAGRA